MISDDPTEPGTETSPPEFRRLEEWCQLLMQATMAVVYSVRLYSNTGMDAYIEHNALLVAFLTTYGKCFHPPKGGAPKLDEGAVFKGNEALLTTHRRIMDLRDQYAGHNGISDVVEGVLLVRESDDAYTVETRLVTRFPSGEYQSFYNAARIMSQYTQETFEDRLQKKARKLGKTVKISGHPGRIFHP